MKLTEQKAIDVLTTYTPQVGEGNNWNILIEAIKKLRSEDLINFGHRLLLTNLMFSVEDYLSKLDYKNTFWAVVEAINFINELKNED